MRKTTYNCDQSDQQAVSQASTAKSYGDLLDETHHKLATYITYCLASYALENNNAKDKEAKAQQYVIQTLNGSFKTPKSIENLMLAYNNQPFILAMKNDYTQVMQYLVEHNTDRGKFLIVCMENYALIDELIKQAAEKIEAGKYDSQCMIHTMKLLIDIKPTVIKDVMSQRLEALKTTDPESAALLSKDLKSVTMSL